MSLGKDNFHQKVCSQVELMTVCLHILHPMRSILLLERHMLIIAVRSVVGKTIPCGMLSIPM